jgi:CRP/FNR family transcriptional regulator, polysaccharide utilization system transcription regulator
MIGKFNIAKEKIAKDISELWNTLDDKQHSLLMKKLEVKRYKKNEMVYHCDEAPTHIWCLVHGKVKVYKDGIVGKNQIIRAIKPIEFFGFRAYFAGEVYKTSAMALENSVIASLPLDTLLEMMKTNFNISYYFIRYLSVTVGDSDDRTVSLTQKHIRGRLAESLLYLKDSYGLEEDGQTLDICLSREDMANLSSMTTSNAIRTLSAFAAEGLIATDGKKIKLLDVEAISRESEN